MRLIDADNLRGRVCARFLCTEPSSAEERRFAIVLGLIDSEPTIALPPNNPLTLEELREMDGEPVWVAEERRYGILEVGDDNFVVTLDHLKWGIVCPIQTEDRVGGMTFFRRRPEEAPR